MSSTIKVFKVTGHRDLGAGASCDLLSIAFGVNEDAAWRNWNNSQNLPAFSSGLNRRCWMRHELHFEPVPQETHGQDARATTL